MVFNGRFADVNFVEDENGPTRDPALVTVTSTCGHRVWYAAIGNDKYGECCGSGDLIPLYPDLIGPGGVQNQCTRKLADRGWDVEWISAGGGDWYSLDVRVAIVCRRHPEDRRFAEIISPLRFLDVEEETVD